MSRDRPPEFMLIDLLACPGCGGDLRTSPSGATLAESQALDCVACGISHRVCKGIPRFVPVDHYSSSFGLQWTSFSRVQIDSFSGLDLSRNRFFAETGWDHEWLADKVVLDLGCGAGRFLDIACRYARAVVGVDGSTAVDAAQANLERYGNVHLIQGDLFRLPFKDEVFDACYCIGVLQHTPAPLEAVTEQSRVLEPGGSVAVTVYERRRWTMFHSKYLARRVTTRLSPTRLLRTLGIILPAAFVLTDLLFRIPRIGRVFEFLIPVANYVHGSSFSRRQRYRWALLDTFDMLSPAFDQPLAERELRDALEEAGIDAERSAAAGLNLVGTKRVSASPAASISAAAS